jgi:hypothetical protein
MGVRIIHVLKSVKLDELEKARYRPTDQFPVLWAIFMYTRRALLNPLKIVHIRKQNERDNSTQLGRAYKS